MALTQNQLNDEFTKQLKRPATDFEYNNYKNSSVQDVANLGKTYSGLNKDSSITDYLRYNGIDPSMSNRTQLATKYGIANYGGSADANMALLSALKGTAPKVTQPSGNAQSGTVATAADKVGAIPLDSNGSVTREGKIEQFNEADAASKTQGSVQDAANSSGSQNAPASSSTYTPDPALASALQTYQSTQKQIADIDKALADEFDTKKQQVIASGGIVNAAQLMGMVRAEKAPLIAQRQELASQQSDQGKTYQQMLSNDKQNRADFDKQTALTEKKREFDTSQSSKTSQFDQKIAQSNVKVSKVAVYDDNGTKVGEKVVKTNLIDGTPIQTPTYSAAAADYTGTKNEQLPADWSLTPDTPTTTNGNQIDKASGLTLNAIYQNALQYMSTGKMPTLGVGSKPKTIAARNAIQNKSGALLAAAGISLPQAQALFKGDAKAASDTIGRTARIETTAKTLTKQFPRLIELSSKVNTTSFTESDLSAVKIAALRKTGDVDASNYLELINSVRGDYAAMIASIGGSKGGQSYAQTATEAIPVGMTPDQIAGIQKTIELTAQKATESSSEVISGMFDNTPSGGGGTNNNTDTSGGDSGNPLGI